MKRMSLGFLMTFSVSLSAWSLSGNVQTLVRMETKANAVATRSSEGVRMPHYEIPLELLEESKAFNLSEKIYNTLVFTKNGKQYVRWVVNPEDTKWHKDVENFLRSKGLQPQRKYYFTGYQTASRSYIVEDPTGQVQFSIKTSTDKTGGNWTDKKQDFKDGYDIRAVSDYMTRLNMAKKFENFELMYEPLTIGLQAVDQSIVVRELGGLTRSNDKIYVPGFSVLHNETGKKIAAMNGSNDPYKFWTEHYIIPMAKAAAEMGTRSGVWFDSPHGQNFLVELDKNYKPTGKVVLRDLGDIYISRPILKALGEEKTFKDFSVQDHIQTNLFLGFGPLHGNQAPTWVNSQQYSRWQDMYSETLMNEISRMTNVPVSALAASKGKRDMSYVSVSLQTKGQAWQNYFNKMAQPVRFCKGVY